MAWLASMPQPSVTQLIGTGLCLCAELMGFALGLLSLPLCRWLRRIGCRVGKTLHVILSRLYSCSMTVRGSMSPFCKFLVLWLKKVIINSETRGKCYWCLRENLQGRQAAAWRTEMDKRKRKRHAFWVGSQEDRQSQQYNICEQVHGQLCFYIHTQRGKGEERKDIERRKNEVMLFELEFRKIA